MISVIIPTLNRDIKILQCLESLLHTNDQCMEPIVLDQNHSTSPALKNFIRMHPSIKYIKTNTINKSLALNKAIIKASGSIIAFTDDDCIVSKTWLSEIRSSFKKRPDISCVTGNTYPYGSIPRWKCPPTMSKKSAVFSRPQHHSAIGYGNNYAIRKSIFQSIGMFKTWLGPGSIGSNCEDGEMLLCMITTNHKIFHNSRAAVFHNKTLEEISFSKQHASYICGETACYTYYWLKGWKFAQRVLQNNMIDSGRKIKFVVLNFLKGKKLYSYDYVHAVYFTVARIRGLLIGLFFYVKETMYSSKTQSK